MNLGRAPTTLRILMATPLAVLGGQGMTVTHPRAGTTPEQSRRVRRGGQPQTSPGFATGASAAVGEEPLGCAVDQQWRQGGGPCPGHVIVVAIHVDVADEWEATSGRTVRVCERHEGNLW